MQNYAINVGAYNDLINFYHKSFGKDEEIVQLEENQGEKQEICDNTD